MHPARPGGRPDRAAALRLRRFRLTPDSRDGHPSPCEPVAEVEVDRRQDRHRPRAPTASSPPSPAACRSSPTSTSGPLSTETACGSTAARRSRSRSPRTSRSGPIEIPTIYLSPGCRRRRHPDRAVRRLHRRARARSQASVDRIGRSSPDVSFPAGRRQPRPGRPRLRLQAAQRRRPVGRRRRRQGRRLPRSSTSTAASTRARSSSTFADFLSLKAIGLITTRMPDGSPGLLAADHHHRRVRHRHPARLRLHAARRRRPARAQPHRCVLEALAEGVRTGAVEQHHVPDGRRRQRAADHQRPARHLPAARGHAS